MLGAHLYANILILLTSYNWKNYFDQSGRAQLVWSLPLSFFSFSVRLRHL